MAHDVATMAQRGPTPSACERMYPEALIHKAPNHFGRRKCFRKAYEDCRFFHIVRGKRS